MGMGKTGWNERQQVILEKTFTREIRRITASGFPGAHQVVASYQDRLHENKTMLRGVEK